MRAKGNAEIEQIKAQRCLNHELAGLIRVGFHDPKNFPKLDDLLVEKKAKADPEDLHSYLMALTLQSEANAN